MLVIWFVIGAVAVLGGLKVLIDTMENRVVKWGRHSKEGE